jgi:hypothetical protein
MYENHIYWFHYKGDMVPESLKLPAVPQGAVEHILSMTDLVE